MLRKHFGRGIFALLLSCFIVTTVWAQAGWILPVNCRQTGRYHADYRGVTGSGENWHTGIDYGCRTGTPVVAPYDAVVYVVYDNWFDYGVSVWLYHGLDQNGLPVFTFPTHLSSSSVVTGQFVRQGEEVALTGSGPPGRALPAHLHWGASNKPPEWFSTWEEHAQDRADGRGWFDPASLGVSIIIAVPVVPDQVVMIPEPGVNVMIPPEPLPQNLPFGSYWRPAGVVLPDSTAIPEIVVQPSTPVEQPPNNPVKLWVWKLRHLSPDGRKSVLTISVLILVILILFLATTMGEEKGVKRRSEN